MRPRALSYGRILSLGLFEPQERGLMIGNCRKLSLPSRQLSVAFREGITDSEPGDI